MFSNTTPFIALSSIGKLELLPALFGKIHVAEAVIDECTAGGDIVVSPLRKLDWIVPVPNPTLPAPHVLIELDKGEKATLLAALAHQANLVLIDEKIARNMAEYLGLKVAGTLGVLLKARKAGLIASSRDAANAMRSQGGFYNPPLIDRLATTVDE